MSFVQVGSFLNAVIFPPVTQILIMLVGWRLAWVILALTVSLIMLPLTALFFKNKPKDLGLDGEPEVQEEEDDDFDRD